MRELKPIITCPKCGGDGHVEMSDDMLATLKAVQSVETVDDVMAHLKWAGSPTAINNRLEDLRELGFVIRQRFGRQWSYTLTAKGRKACK